MRTAVSIAGRPPADPASLRMGRCMLQTRSSCPSGPPREGSAAVTAPPSVDDSIAGAADGGGNSNRVQSLGDSSRLLLSLLLLRCCLVQTPSLDWVTSATQPWPSHSTHRCTPGPHICSLIILVHDRNSRSVFTLIICTCIYGCRWYMLLPSKVSGTFVWLNTRESMASASKSKSLHILKP